MELIRQKKRFGLKIYIYIYIYNKLLNLLLTVYKLSLGLLRASLDNQTDLIKKILENMNSKNESEDCF